MSNTKSRKKSLEKIAEQAKINKIVKEAMDDGDQNNADAANYSEDIFNKLLESIKIDGLED